MVRKNMVRTYLNTSSVYYLNSILVFCFLYVTEKYQKPVLTLWFIYGLIPVLDTLLPYDEINPTPEEEKILVKQWKWIIPVYSYVASEWFCLFWVINYINTHNLELLQLTILVISLSQISAIGFLVSHELIHKRDWLGKTVGTLDMLKSLYMHFYQEHLYGHHKFVATPKDPGTAPLNQTLYQFIPNTLVVSFKNCWKRESKKLAKQGRSPWSLENKLILCVIVEIVFTLCVYLIFGLQGMVVFLTQAAISTLILETITYIRHYGLTRKEISPGVYEKVSIKHSWNASHFLQNLFMLKLQRHSDHHANAYKPYQILASYSESPTLPCGYASCIPAAFFPPAWFAIVNPIVEGTNQFGKPTKEQMKKATTAFNILLVIQSSLLTALVFVV